MGSSMDIWVNFFHPFLSNEYLENWFRVILGSQLVHTLTQMTLKLKFSWFFHFHEYSVEKLDTIVNAVSSFFTLQRQKRRMFKHWTTVQCLNILLFCPCRVKSKFTPLYVYDEWKVRNVKLHCERHLHTLYTSKRMTIVINGF